MWETGFFSGKNGTLLYIKKIQEGSFCINVDNFFFSYRYLSMLFYSNISFVIYIGSNTKYCVLYDQFCIYVINLGVGFLWIDGISHPEYMVSIDSSFDLFFSHFLSACLKMIHDFVCHFPVNRIFFVCGTWHIWEDFVRWWSIVWEKTFLKFTLNHDHLTGHFHQVISLIILKQCLFCHCLGTMILLCCRCPLFFNNNTSRCFIDIRSSSCADSSFLEFDLKVWTVTRIFLVHKLLMVNSSHIVRIFVKSKTMALSYIIYTFLVHASFSYSRIFCGLNEKLSISVRYMFLVYTW